MNAPQTKTAQQTIDNLPSQTWDVVIVGAGPAGSICARRLAQSGLAVLLLDKERFPRHKVCGDLLIADSQALLRKVGLYDRIAAVAHHSDALDVFSPSGNHFSIPDRFLSQRRYAFDNELANAAADAGAVFAIGNVTAVDEPDSGGIARVTLSESTEPVLARYIVLAAGAVVDLPSRLGLVGDPHPSAVAMRCYVISTYPVPNTIIAYDRSILPGYGWIVPLGQTDSGAFVYNVGCGTSLRFVRDGRHHLKQALMTFMENFEPTRALLAQSNRRSKVAGASLRCGLPDIERAVGNRRLLVGESAGATYPFTGEGIGKAMETGLAAAEIIIDALRTDTPARLESYRDYLRSLKPRYDGYETAEKWLGSRRLNDFIAGRIARSRYLRELVGEFMAETSDPGDLFKLASLVKSFRK